MTPLERAEKVKLAPVLPSGPTTAEMALVGAGGGDDERREGTAFVGRAGRFLNGMLDAGGLQRESLYLTNVLPHFIPNNDVKRWYRPLRKGEIGEWEGLMEASPIRWDSDEMVYRGLTAAGMEAREAILAELASLPNLKVVMPLGDFPTFALLGKGALMKVRGSPFPLTLPGGKGVVVIPSIHPADILRGRFMMRYPFAADLRKACRYLEEGYEPPEIDLAIPSSREELLTRLAGVGAGGGPTGIDIETPGYQIGAIGIAPAPDYAFCWMVDEHGRDAQEAVKGLIGDPGRSWVFQNGIFDRFYFLDRWGVEFAGECEDTMYLHSVLNPELSEIKGNGLDYLASIYTDRPFWKEDGKEARQTGDVTKFLEYCASDASATREVWDALVKECQEDRLGEGERLWAAYRRHMATIPAFLHTMKRGIPIDPHFMGRARKENIEGVKRVSAELNTILAPKLREHAEGLREKLAEGERLRSDYTIKAREARKNGEALSPVDEMGREKVRKEVPRLKKEVERFAPLLEGVGEKPLINPDSQDQCKWYFYTFLGIKPYMQRRAGGGSTPTVDDTALARLAKGTSNRPGLPEAEVMQRYRALTTYGDNFLGIQRGAKKKASKLIADDGRLYFGVKPRGTYTGRQSTGPNAYNLGRSVQNCPAEFREGWIPEEGCVFLEVDKKGAEWVCVAYFSEDARMLEVCEKGLDPHGTTAYYMAGSPWGKEETIRIFRAEDRALGHVTNRLELAAYRSGEKELTTADWRSIGEDWEEPWKEFLKGWRECSWIPQSSTFRQGGKRSGLAFNYDRGADSVAVEYGMILSEAQELRRMYRADAYPGIVRWHSSTRLEAETTRRIYAPLDGIWRIQGPIDDSKARELYAFRPQWTVVNMVNLGWKGVHERHQQGAGMFVTNQVHDSLLLQFPVDRLGELEGELEAVCKDISPTIEWKGRSFTIANEIKVGFDGKNLHETTAGQAAAKIEELIADGLA